MPLSIVKNSSPMLRSPMPACFYEGSVILDNVSGDQNRASAVSENPNGNGLEVTATPLILCVDDEAIGLQIRKVVLERAGYRVVTALNGTTGLGLFAEYPVDAVILDYSMPDMNGDQVAHQMRRSRATVPILLLSAYVNLPPEVTASVDFILTKGAGPVILIEKVQEMLASSRPATEDSH